MLFWGLLWFRAVPCAVQAGQGFPLMSRVEFGPEVPLQSQESPFFSTKRGPLCPQSSLTCASYCSAESKRGRVWISWVTYRVVLKASVGVKINHALPAIGA